MISKLSIFIVFKSSHEHSETIFQGTLVKALRNLNDFEAMLTSGSQVGVLKLLVKQLSVGKKRKSGLFLLKKLSATAFPIVHLFL